MISHTNFLSLFSDVWLDGWMAGRKKNSQKPGSLSPDKLERCNEIKKTTDQTHQFLLNHSERRCAQSFSSLEAWLVSSFLLFPFLFGLIKLQPSSSSTSCSSIMKFRGIEEKHEHQDSWSYTLSQSSSSERGERNIMTGRQEWHRQQKKGREDCR